MWVPADTHRQSHILTHATKSFVVQKASLPPDQNIASKILIVLRNHV